MTPHGSDNLENPDQLPLDLQLDLLVDEELSEEKRRTLLKSLDGNPAHWRDLSIRFLERQVEKKSVHQLITGQTADSELQNSERGVQNFPIRHWLTPARYTALAAGLLIALASALLTFYFLRPSTQIDNSSGPIASSETITTPLPGSIWNTAADQPVKVDVHNVAASAQDPILFPPESSAQPPLRRTVVIKPDGANNILIIPVTNLQYQ